MQPRHGETAIGTKLTCSQLVNDRVRFLSGDVVTRKETVKALEAVFAKQVGQGEDDAALGSCRANSYLQA
jgi:hypothetical protein